MNRNLVFVLAGIAVVALVVYAVVHTNANAPAAASPAASAPSPEPIAAGPRVEAAELKKLVDQNGVTLLDVRDAQAYVAEHIPGSLQIPLARVEGEVAYLPKEKPIVAYCTCPHDEAAVEAVAILDHAGVHGARALRGGLQEWARIGYPTASGSR